MNIWLVGFYCSFFSNYVNYISGAPYVYETLLGTRFRISPSTFFQPNSRGAEVLYTQISNALGLPKAERMATVVSEVQGTAFDTTAAQDESLEETEAKKPKLESEVKRISLDSTIENTKLHE
jgi:hypothetical protein